MSFAQPAPFDPHDRSVDVERRFGDMDALGHVNNVRYLDYLTEGRESWLGDYDVPEDQVRCRAHRIAFAAPMVFARADAEVRTSVVAVDGDEVRLAQVLITRRHVGDAPLVHVRSESTLEVADAASLRELRAYADPARAHEWREVVTTGGPPRAEQPVTVRSRDLGVTGVARDDAVMEWFQEARVRYFMDLHTLGEEWGAVVVARLDLDLLRDVRRDDAVAVRTWVAHLGRTSFTVNADLVDDTGEVRARATAVAVSFDPATQRPAPLAAAHRARLEQELADS
ncbi:acyl-CoA thioesterase [Nocardioides aequoreus]|uniref:acyl-CoA thioesterase n=1 Tax=Nocardioides aequoreus TaxID=397278 RepID=UPI00068C6C8F|nr:thioesterase family protein [Nocardioides aequoreus]